MGLDPKKRTLDEPAAQIHPLFDVSAAKRVVPLREIGQAEVPLSLRPRRQRLPLALALGLVLSGAVAGSLFALSWVKRQQAVGVSFAPLQTAISAPAATPQSTPSPSATDLSLEKSSIATAASPTKESNGAEPKRSPLSGEGVRKESRKEMRKIERERRMEERVAEIGLNGQDPSGVRERRVRGKKAQEEAEDQMQRTRGRTQREMEDQLRRIREIFEGVPR